MRDPAEIGDRASNINLSYRQILTNTFIEACTPQTLKIKEPANLNLRDVRDVVKVKDYEMREILLGNLSRPNLIAWVVKSYQVFLAMVREKAVILEGRMVRYSILP